MGTDLDDEEIVVSEDGTTLPTIDVLTGRAFLTGKSGSGKSTTCSVIAEELLDREFNLLIVDTDGEYHTLTERYDVLHVGGDEFADVEVDPTDAEELAKEALVENVPVVLDVSGYDETTVADDLIEGVVSHLFSLEKEHRKPLLLIVEELQEYLPQSGGNDDLANLLKRVAKRGRKRGLGICGISQRPSSVDKDFITQCDWMAWHKLTWKNDVDVVRELLGTDWATSIQEFEPGEAILMTDWDDRIRRIRFREKRTPDAGATPGLDQYEHRTERTNTDSEGQTPGATSDALEGADDGTDAATADTPNGGAAVHDESAVNHTAHSELEAVSALKSETGRTDASDSGRSPTGESSRQSAPNHGPVAGRERPSGAGHTASQMGMDDHAGGLRRPRLEEPDRPEPPSRPERRDGVAGNLLEFGELVLYLGLYVTYRVRRMVYRMRAT